MKVSYISIHLNLLFSLAVTLRVTICQLQRDIQLTSTQHVYIRNEVDI